MRNKRIIVTLLAAASIALAVMYTMTNMGAQHPGAKPQAESKPTSPAISAIAEQPQNAAQAKRPAGGERPVASPTADSGVNRLNKASDTSSVNTTNRSPKGEQSGNTQLAQVGVIDVTADSYNAKVRGYGQVVPQDSLSLVAQVSGQVTDISSSFKTGALVANNTVLARIDDTNYQQALASANATYQAAVVSLEEERLQGIQAKDEWTRSGLDGEPLSALVLREPQLKAAQATLDEAEQSVNSAKRDLAFTSLRAPFNALVVSRDIALGSYVQAGSAVATLYSADIAEVAIGLSPSQWAQLPASAISQKQEVWLVMPSTGQLAKFTPSVLFESEGYAYITPPKTSEVTGDIVSNVAGKTSGNASDNSMSEQVGEIRQALVVARPLNSYLVNTKVLPVVEGQTGGQADDK
ncbi:efflux RND transporter periplasmic adaptor subunit [Alteromonas sp. DY56-G5]|uniref:efflux RND transporter periplasmic adaptor subunit n=1 Tax=Alteromonas sp. DY56-G5 TaxID=2967128 RepID=UPI00352ACF20